MKQEAKDTSSLQNSFRLVNMLTGETKLLIGQTNIREDTHTVHTETEVISKPILILWTHHLLLFILVQLISQLRQCNLHTLSCFSTETNRTEF